MCISFLSPPVFSDPLSLSLNTKQILAAMYRVKSIISLYPLPVCLRRPNTQRERLKKEELVRVSELFNLGLLSGTKMLCHHTEPKKMTLLYLSKVKVVHRQTGSLPKVDFVKE